MWDYRSPGPQRQRSINQNGTESANERARLGRKQAPEGAVPELCSPSEADMRHQTRLLRLRAEIALGSYQVPTEALAESMLSRGAQQRVTHQRMYPV
jgi:anti-sigma28 factor (negative regulator of flagellin synthesis)